MIVAGRLLGEVAAPVVPAVGAAIIGLGLVVLFLIGYGLAKTGQKLTAIIFGPLTGISIAHFHPFSFLSHLGDPIGNFFGSIAAGCDRGIGWSLHHMAEVWLWAGRVMFYMGWSTFSALRGLYDDLFHHTIPAQVAPGAKAARQAQAEARAAAAQAQVAAAAAAAAAGSVPLPWRRWRRAVDARLRGLEAGASITIPSEIGSLQRQVEKQHAGLSRLEKILAGLGVTALVATALSKLDLGHLRCRNNRRLGKWLCGVPLGVLEALLGGAMAVFTVINLCSLARFAAAIAKDAEPILRRLAAVEGAALCGGRLDPPPELVLAAARLPVARSPIML